MHHVPPQPPHGWPTPHAWTPPVPKPSTTLALTGVLLAAVGASFAWIPFLGVVGLLMAVAGLIIGVVARRRATQGRAGGPTMALWAVIAGVIGVVLGAGGVVLSVLIVQAEQERIASTRAHVEDVRTVDDLLR